MGSLVGIGQGGQKSRLVLKSVDGRRKIVKFD